MILVLDNHDSYTYNLVQALRAHTAHEVRVVSSSDADEAVALVRSGAAVALVVSPGPGHPAKPADFAGADAVLAAAMERGELPILGVCLGHQGLARRLGFVVEAAPRPRHGWRSPVRHTADAIFAGIPQGTLATRYHSLAMRPGGGTVAVPGERIGPIRVTAVSEDDVVQGFDVPGHPWFGVQFHPESIASEHGPLLLQNFLRIVEDAAGSARSSLDPGGVRTSSAGVGGNTGATRLVPGAPRVAAEAGSYAISWHADPDRTVAFIESHVLHRGAGSFRFDVPDADGRTPRWTVLGDAVDLLERGEAHVLRYRPDRVSIDTYTPTGTDREVEVRRREEGCADPLTDLEHRLGRCDVGAVPAEVSDPPVGSRSPDAEPRGTPHDHVAVSSPSAGEEPVELPFRGGYIGALGYEAGVRAMGLDPARGTQPEAVFVRPVRYVVVEPARRLVTLVVHDADAALAEATCREEAGRIAGSRTALGARSATAGAAHADGTDRVAATRPRRTSPVAGRWRHDRAAYLERIAACRLALEAGDSYELCLTNRFDVDAAVDPDALELFRELRRTQAAPFAALLEFDDDGDPIAIVSASPERFVRLVGDALETKPIKGTAARCTDPAADARAAATLASDPKAFAENLMIVDLLRNDLGRVCVPGSVTVPALMHVETYPSVHQLVSTVRGTLERGHSPCDVLRALHPGGSMTGAPKERTVRILETLEGAPRGFYAGALGIVGADGRLEQSIVIRTAVRAGGRWSIGAGGAVVLDSDPDAEFDEVELKADAIRRAFTAVAGG
ncbi:aminodeoxychorismate synthase [Pseudoclavibacter chungangensis]|uniref:aminodeoxychorismate synthase n=1 Tax=Pseudoclavibacter chungangensis TaxID=587635 RepID=A0A7J5BR00_9MICO|nr:chorismate-binding protein [Pseudoclavibacter chungangensis]KAB1656695.1 aminodeoxychorismate synthase [Pseudoclavibacter chungangensis]NYJ67851.1 para-aminobenzoate synthetase [Pseudoclavibacter chungangensis]